MSDQSSKNSILEFFTEKGILLSPNALQIIIKRNLANQVMNLLSSDIIESGYLSEKDVLNLMKRSSQPHVEEYEVNVQDVTVGSSVEDFRGYFVSRFEKLRKIILTSMSMLGSVDIESARKSPERRVKTVGMISSVGTTKNGHLKLTIEDLKDHMDVIIMKDKIKQGEVYLQDEVIGVVGSLSSGSGRRVIFADEIVRPDTPSRIVDDNGGEPVYVASLSDIHVGSKEFRKDEFRRMIKWIKSSAEDSQQLKYLILSGDVVDGIGVYPNQENDLDIVNPTEQYELLAELISDIPRDVMVFVIPGNHDVVRIPEPQPVFSKKIGSMFPPNVVMLPNPYTLHLEKKRILVYHGMSLNDMIELIPGASFDTVGPAIEALLKRRHLAPVYGGKTPLIPTPVDHHVIEEVPDIFITGHVHSHAVGWYRGIRYVNSSTWQSQTEFQKIMNFSPNPSILTLFDLNSRTTLKRDFKKREVLN